MADLVRQSWEWQGVSEVPNEAQVTKHPELSGEGISRVEQEHEGELHKQAIAVMSAHFVKYAPMSNIWVQ